MEIFDTNYVRIPVSFFIKGFLRQDTAALARAYLGITGSGGTVNDFDVVFTDITTNNASTAKHGYLRKLSNVSTEFLSGTGAWSVPTLSTIAESNVTFTDITTNDVTSTKHGFAPKAPADATKFLNGAATPAYALVKDSDLSTSDITTNNVTTAKHGFTPKLPNDATKYLDGTGSYSVPVGGPGTDYFWDYMEASLLPVGTTTSVAYNCIRNESVSTSVNPTATDPAGCDYQTTASINNAVQGSELQVNRCIYDRPFEYRGIFSINTITSVRFWCGMSNEAVGVVGQSDTPAGKMALFRFSTGAGETTFKAYVNKSGSSEVLTTGITVTAGQLYRFKITWDGTTTGKIKFYIDGTLVATSTLDMTAGDVFGMYSSLTTLANSARNYRAYGMKSRI